MRLHLHNSYSIIQEMLDYSSKERRNHPAWHELNVEHSRVETHAVLCQPLAGQPPDVAFDRRYPRPTVLLTDGALDWRNKRPTVHSTDGTLNRQYLRPTVPSTDGTIDGGYPQPSPSMSAAATVSMLASTTLITAKAIARYTKTNWRSRISVNFCPAVKPPPSSPHSSAHRP